MKEIALTQGKVALVDDEDCFRSTNATLIRPKTLGSRCPRTEKRFPGREEVAPVVARKSGLPGPLALFARTYVDLVRHYPSK
jgi:hypothetical protein